MTASVFLKPGKEIKTEAGHLWVYAGEIARTSDDAVDGGEVEVRTASGRLLGRGLFNRRSQITVRLFTRTAEPLDGGLFRRRLESALRYRERVVHGTTAFRLVFSEGDFLPGLIVDRYADTVVLQTLTAGMEARKPLLLTLLDDLLHPRLIYERNDVRIRRLEGLPSQAGFLQGEGATVVEIEEGGARFLVDFAEGQKTGFFLDQRENRVHLREYAGGAEILDAFCYTGAFAVHAAVGGARRVVGLDISEGAVGLARRHAETNGVAERCEFRSGNAFDEMRRLEREGARFDLVVLDPPAFVKSKRALETGLAGYKEINLRALRLLRSGGLLVSCSCSYHVSEDLLLAVVAEAALDARRSLRLVERRGQARDHPVLPAMPETSYLKCLILEAS